MFLDQKSAVVLHFDIQKRATLQHFCASISKRCCSVAFLYSKKSNTTAQNCFYIKKSVVGVAFRYSEKNNTTTLFYFYINKVLYCCTLIFRKKQHYSTFLFLYQKGAVVLHFDIQKRARLQHRIVSILEKCCSVAC